MALLIDHVIAHYSLGDVNDAHSGAYHLTNVNVATFVAGKVGNGVDCDVTNQSGLIRANADAAAFQMGTTSRSVAFWFNAAALPAINNSGALVHMGAVNAADQGWHVIFGNTGGNGQIIARLSNGTTLYSASSSAIYTAATWYHVVAIWKRAGNLELYVNNVRAATVSISAASASDIQATQDLKIGGRHGTSVWLDGIVDEVSFFDHELSLPEVDWLYNDGTGRSYADISAATTLGARIRENFGGLATGTGTPTGFTALGSANKVFEVVTDGTSEGGKALEIQSSGAGRGRLTLDVLDGMTQQDVVMLFEVSTTGLSPGLIINAINGAGTETEYLLEAFDDNLTLWEASAGTYTSRATNGTALPSALASGVVYAMRFRRQENTYYGRIWIPASEDEPAAWDVSSLDGSPRGAGGAGISYPSSSGTLTVHAISAAYGGDCGCELADADFPDVGLYATSELDGSLRVYGETATTNAVVSIFGGTSIANVRACAVHMANQTVFVAKRAAGRVVRVDRYGLNETTINDTIAAPFGLDIDEAAGTLFISDLDNGQFYKDVIGGGSQTNPLTLATASHVHWDAVNSKLWWVGNGNVYSGNSSFGSSTDYLAPPATPLHAISDGTTVSVSDYDVAGADGVFTKPVASPTDAYTTADATSLIDALTINGDRDTAYGIGATVDAIIKWSAYPPASANRSTFATLVDGRYVDWFEFAAVDGVSRASDEISAYALGAKTATGIAVAVDEFAFSTTGYKTGIGIVTASHEAISFAVYTRASSGVVVVSDEMTGQTVCGTLTRSGQVVAGDEIIGYGVCSTSVVPSVITLSIAHLHKIGLTMAHLNKITLTIYEVD